MENRIKKLLLRLIQNNFFWMLMKPFAMTGTFLVNAKNEQLQNALPKPPRIFSDLTVQNGPFAGLTYPDELAIGSAFYPKIVGCYERELWEVFAFFKQQSYERIVDVGSAEGYYAVGLAKYHPNAQVLACDTDENAQQAVLQMAEINGLSSIQVQGTFDAQQLMQFDFKSKGLLICDCEGFEKQLFTTENCKNLSNVDVLIELHDFIDPTISTTLKNLLAPSHDLLSIFSLDDMVKLDNYQFDSILSFDRKTRYECIREGRPTRMEWLVALPKSADSYHQLQSLKTATELLFPSGKQVNIVHPI